MTEPREIRNAYSRGFNAGSRRRWPKHRPPEPPNAIVAELMTAAKSLRNIVDDELAVRYVDEDEEALDKYAKRLRDGVDDVDVALEKITAWLLEIDYEIL